MNPNAKNNLQTSIDKASGEVVGTRTDAWDKHDELYSINRSDFYNPDEKIDELTAAEVKQIEAENKHTALKDLRNQVNVKRKSAAVGAGAVVGVVGAALGAKLLHNLYTGYKWKKQGCDAITNPSKKLECMNYVKNNLLKELQKSMNKCTDDACKQLIKSKIDKLIG